MILQNIHNEEMKMSDKPEFNISADATKLKELVRQASELQTKIEGLRDEIKAAKDTAKDELGVEPKKFGQLFKMYHKRSRDEVEAETEEVVDLYDKVFGDVDGNL